MMQPQPEWLATLLEEATVEFPTTPDLAPGVLAAIREERAQQPAWGRHGWAVAIASTAIIVLVAALSIRESREAIAGFLGLGVEGERIEVVATVPPGGVPTPPAIEDLARPVTLSEAASRLGLELLLPGGQEPSDLYYTDYRIDDIGSVFYKPFAILRYRDYNIWQSTTEGVVGKGIYLGSDTVVEETSVGEHFAYWIEGGPRLVVIEAPGGVRVAASERAVDANTLVWSDGGRYFRIEGDIGLDEALAIAESLR